MREISAHEALKVKSCSEQGCAEDAERDGRCDDHSREHQRLLFYRVRGRQLSPREMRVLVLASEGLTAEKTAAKLGTGLETVKRQRRIVIAKLKAENMTEAVALAFRYRLIS